MDCWNSSRISKEFQRFHLFQSFSSNFPLLQWNSTRIPPEWWKDFLVGIHCCYSFVLKVFTGSSIPYIILITEIFSVSNLKSQPFTINSASSSGVVISGKLNNVFFMLLLPCFCYLVVIDTVCVIFCSNIFYICY